MSGEALQAIRLPNFNGGLVSGFAGKAKHPSSDEPEEPAPAQAAMPKMRASAVFDTYRNMPTGGHFRCRFAASEILTDRLLANNDWDKAGHEYAEEHDRVYVIIHNVTTWSRQIFMENGAKADARREKVMPSMASDPNYFPDHGISGPDLPFDRELFEARFAGE